MVDKKSLIKILNDELKKLENWSDDAKFVYEIRIEEKQKCPKCGSYNYNINSFGGYTSGSCGTCDYRYFED